MKITVTKRFFKNISWNKFILTVFETWNQILQYPGWQPLVSPDLVGCFRLIWNIMVYFFTLNTPWLGGLIYGTVSQEDRIRMAEEDMTASLHQTERRKGSGMVDWEMDQSQETGAGWLNRTWEFFLHQTHKRNEPGFGELKDGPVCQIGRNKITELELAWWTEKFTYQGKYAHLLVE